MQSKPYVEGFGNGLGYSGNKWESIITLKGEGKAKPGNDFLQKFIGNF